MMFILLDHPMVFSPSKGRTEFIYENNPFFYFSFFPPKIILQMGPYIIGRKEQQERGKSGKRKIFFFPKALNSKICFTKPSQENIRNLKIRKKKR